MTSSSSSSLMPPGACTSAISPSDLPINARAIGEPTETLPPLRSASSSPTICSYAMRIGPRITVATSISRIGIRILLIPITLLGDSQLMTPMMLIITPFPTSAMIHKAPCRVVHFYRWRLPPPMFCLPFMATLAICTRFRRRCCSQQQIGKR